MRAGPEREQMDTVKDDSSKSLVLANRDSIIKQVAEGTRLTEIASKLGLTHSAISKQLASDPDYQQAKIIHHATRLDNAEMALECSEDQFTLARARELHKAYSWRASVEVARLWGNKQELTVNQVTVDINGLLDQRMARIASSVSNTVDSTCSQVETDDAS